MLFIRIGLAYTKSPQRREERLNLGNVDNEKRTLCTTHNV